MQIGFKGPTSGPLAGEDALLKPDRPVLPI